MFELSWTPRLDQWHKDSPLRKEATIHQVTTMLATSKNVLFPGPSHLLTTRTDNPDTLIITWAPASG